MKDMKHIKEADIERKRAIGARGYVDMIDAVVGVPTIGVRIVAANSDVPSRTHVHPEKQVMYLISGSLSVTNGIETISLEPGDFVLLEANEEHYVMTDSGEAKVFEVKY
ncbi:MAG: cupin domain-containing protein [Candidatus Thorarchaeota archaeon]|nr:cupin domain-containing protein [Candidatus Thorarchaeota archaeon]